MRFLISPAKSLDFDSPPSSLPHTQPRFIEESTALMGLLREKSVADIAALMDLSEALAVLNFRRYAAWQPHFHPGNAREAVFAFRGDVYQGLDADSLDADALSYLQDRLRILSGLHGLLRPLDLIQPYRLEMGTRLTNSRGTDLYAFWGERITGALNAELATDSPPVLVNLASDEYFKAIQPRKLNARLIECRFEDLKGGGYKIISFFAKRARGAMVRFAARHQIQNPEGLKDYDWGGYKYCDAASKEDGWVFRRDSPSV